MDANKQELYEQLNKTKDSKDYIPIIQSVKDFYMILGNKIARSTRETHRRYLSYLESKDTDIRNDRFDKLADTVELDSEKRKGIWFDLEGFVSSLGKKDMELIENSIKLYK